MIRRGRSISSALALAAVVALSLPATASAESILWSMTASPLATTTGAATTFTLTATNEDPLAALLSSSEIGCVEVTLPANFSVSGASVTGSNAGGSWHVDSVVGNRVRVHVNSGGDRLELLGWVQFQVTASASSTGSLTWAGRAYRDDNCGGSGALLGVPPIVVVTGPTITPTPLPTPVPTPTPTPRPSPTPTATPTPALPLPSLPLPSLPVPVIATPPASTATPSAGGGEPASSPRPSATPAINATPSATGSTGAGGVPPTVTPPGGPGGAGGGQDPNRQAIDPGTPSVVFERSDGDVQIVNVSVLAGIAIYAVPAAALALPGVLILVWLALQTLGALAWIPAVRRLGGRDGEFASSAA
jgi:hypothetical protein